MTRITSDRVRRSFETSRITPTDNRYYDDWERGGCAMCALYLDEHGSDALAGVDNSEASDAIHDWAFDQFGKDYTLPFERGFAGCGLYGDEGEDEAQAVADGLLARIEMGLPMPRRLSPRA